MRNAKGDASEVRSNDTYGLSVFDCASVLAVELFSTTTTIYNDGHSGGWAGGFVWPGNSVIN